MEADPNNPQIVRGFDVEIAELIAQTLGRKPEFVQVAFASLDQSAVRGDFDIGLSGIEDTPARRATVAASIPYYRFREVLTVREGDRDRFRTLADLRGRRVATLCKGEEGLRQQLALYHVYYNFCLPHASVRQPLPQPEPTNGTGSAKR